jgi:hypothetical protein
VNGVHLILLGYPNDLLYIKVRFEWVIIRSNLEGLVSFEAVQGVTIFKRVDRNSRNFQLSSRA